MRKNAGTSQRNLPTMKPAPRMWIWDISVTGKNREVWTMLETPHPLENDPLWQKVPHKRKFVSQDAIVYLVSEDRFTRSDDDMRLALLAWKRGEWKRVRLGKIK